MTVSESDEPSFGATLEDPHAAEDAEISSESEEALEFHNEGDTSHVVSRKTNDNNSHSRHHSNHSHGQHSERNHSQRPRVRHQKSASHGTPPTPNMSRDQRSEPFKRMHSVEHIEDRKSKERRSRSRRRHKTESHLNTVGNLEETPKAKLESPVTKNTTKHAVNTSQTLKINAHHTATESPLSQHQPQELQQTAYVMQHQQSSNGLGLQNGIQNGGFVYYPIAPNMPIQHQQVWLLW